MWLCRHCVSVANDFADTHRKLLYFGRSKKLTKHVDNLIGSFPKLCVQVVIDYANTTCAEIVVGYADSPTRCVVTDYADIRVEWGIFLNRTEQVKYQRSGMILGVKIQNIGARVCGARQRERTRVKVFILQKFQGAQISIFFLWKLAWSFLFL